jgi:N-dimethylarginine dimethylaminohydrolase
MCEPAYYGVEYVINPWMEAGRGRVRRQEALDQWNALHSVMSELAAVACIQPQDGLPDMVFTANAGLILENVFVPSNFRHQQRSGEEALYTDWAAKAGFQIVSVPRDIHFEGAGDALFDRLLPVLWLGYGFRTDASAAQPLREIVEPAGYTVEALHLADPRFYHLDTCLCPISDGSVMYYPAAFEDDSVRRIESVVPPDRLIAVSAEDAIVFACNAVNLGGVVVMNDASDELKACLNARGLRSVETPLSQYICAGGAAKCLTLRLDEPAPRT